MVSHTVLFMVNIAHSDHLAAKMETMAGQATILYASHLLADRVSYALLGHLPTAEDKPRLDFQA